MVAAMGTGMRPRYTTHYRSQSMRLDLDESEQFDVPVQRHHRAKQWVRVNGVHVSWATYTEMDLEPGSHMLWALIGNIVKKDDSLGPEVRVPGAYVDPVPDLVASVLTDLRPEWHQ